MSEIGKNYNIRKLKNSDEQKKAAILISKNEPWISYGRDFQLCLKMVQAVTKNVFGFFLDKEIVAVIIIDLNGAFAGYIQTVCVDESCRGLKIGTKLINFAEDIIFKVSPNAFVCYSDIDERPGRLYRRLGYKLVGKLEDYNIQNHAEILLRKSISPKREFYLNK
jgi:ribosomal protein S18 acetylase RimI-like enzyme